MQAMSGRLARTHFLEVFDALHPWKKGVVTKCAGMLGQVSQKMGSIKECRWVGRRREGPTREI